MDPYVFPDSPEMQAFKDLQQRNFIEHIRQYNAQFNFTSIGTNEVKHSGSGPKTYCIQGQLTHNIGPLQPSLNRSGNLRQPSFAQIYMHTSEEQLQHRRNMFPAFSSRYTATIQRVMDLHNPLARTYATAKERLRRAEADGTSGGNLQIVLKAVGGAQARTHNLPTVAQLAVIMEGDGSEPTEGRHVVLQSLNSNRFTAIRETNPLHDALQFPLLFPMGGPGWEYTMTKTDGKSLSLRAFFNYWLQERDGDDFSDMLHRSSMLFKMYTTVGFVRYVEGRYVTSLEAITRIRCYDLQRMSHAVEVLPVHEKDQQHCTYDETHDAESVVARNQKTKLISFFLACAQGLTGIDADFMDKRLRDLRRCNEALPQPLSEDMMLGKAMFYTLKSIDNCFQHHRLSLLDYPTLPQLHEFEVFRDLGERQLLDDPRSRLYVIETSYTRAALDDVLATAATMTDEHRSFPNDPFSKMELLGYKPWYTCMEVVQNYYKFFKHVCCWTKVEAQAALKKLLQLYLLCDNRFHEQNLDGDKPRLTAAKMYIVFQRKIVEDHLRRFLHALAAAEETSPRPAGEEYPALMYMPLAAFRRMEEHSIVGVSIAYVTVETTNFPKFVQDVKECRAIIYISSSEDEEVDAKKGEADSSTSTQLSRKYIFSKNEAISC
ncbi:hypothetical protein DYB38_006980 [Aphanomyces astaci]|uniref:Helitron helicase-like domain-containing protein n=1 Tax=Aphanomyces astaci TaxID=112090 RepID=A0A397DLT0_APHAT|nr:hypothetical protein DYB38_006980 [Aphanomyces astaci]